MKRIGLIGTGLMGAPIAKNWLKKGYEVCILESKSGQSASEKRVSELKTMGAKVAVSLKELCNFSEIIILMLPTSKEVEETTIGEGGLINFLKSESYCIDMTTSDPASTRLIHEKLMRKSIRFFDSPVTGGVMKAESGSLTLFVGGPEDWFRACEELLSAVSAVRTHFGEIGNGHIAKIINNFICIGNLTVFCEALPLASKLGINIERIFNTLLSGTGASEMLKYYGPSIMAGDFSPRFKLSHAFKDIRLAENLTKQLGVELPVLKGMLEDFENAASEGLLEENLSSIIKPIENYVGAKFRLPAK